MGARKDYMAGNRGSQLIYSLIDDFINHSGIMSVIITAE